jgi:hypothetical protein
MFSFKRQLPHGRYAAKPGVYEGRMAANGEGNLIAEEGPRAGEFVAYDANLDAIVFVLKGEQTHNARHHRQFAHVEIGSEEAE